VDNGSGYKNKMMSDESTGLCGRLGITIKHSLPYNSQAKGVIERSHQTLWVALAKKLPSYVGAAMDRDARLEHFKLTRRALKQGGVMPLVPWHIFVELVEAQITEYNARPHRALKKLSPNAKRAEFVAQGWAPDRVEAAEIDTLFRPRVERKLMRSEITLFNNIYFARELEEFHGETVHVAYDIHDASRIWVYLPEGQFLCCAEVNGNRQHYMPVPVIEQARQTRAKGRMGRIDAKRVEILEELHGHAPLVLEPGQVMVGGRVIDVVQQGSEVRAQEPDALARSADTSVIEAEARVVAPAPVPRSERPADENYADWLALDARIARGEEVSKEEKFWHLSYQRTAQFQAHIEKIAATVRAVAA
jgi:putative transposase